MKELFLQQQREKTCGSFAENRLYDPAAAHCRPHRLSPLQTLSLAPLRQQQQDIKPSAESAADLQSGPWGAEVRGQIHHRCRRRMTSRMCWDALQPIGWRAGLKSALSVSSLQDSYRWRSCSDRQQCTAQSVKLH